jgi:hypothetical protein
MSWTVSVLGGKEPPPVHDLPDGWRPEALGSGAEVRGRISAHLPGVDWTDPTWGRYAGDGFTFEFNMGREEPVESFAVHVRGGGDAIADLRRFAVPNGWHLLDWSTGDYIDPQSPSDAGWVGWQAYRDKIRREFGPAGHGG